jgi:type IV secretion system protein TrbG
MKHTITTKRLALGVVAAVLSGCAASTAPPPSKLVPAKLLEINPPAPLPQNVLDDQPASVRAAVQAYHHDHKMRVLHDGITTRFPYDPDSEPTVFCKPLRVSEILLAPGEAVDNAAAGDTERWLIQPTNGRVLIKPKAPGIETNLIILTPQHSYHVTLRSGAKYMPRVAFYYPKEILAEEAARKAALEKRAREAATPATLDKLNFDYTISGPDTPFRPLQAFDNGEQVYIELPDKLMGSDAPALMVAADGGDALVNYQVRGRYLVVDRLFKQAALVSGTGRDRQEVKIVRNGA